VDAVGWACTFAWAWGGVAGRCAGRVRISRCASAGRRFRYRLCFFLFRYSFILSVSCRSGQTDGVSQCFFLHVHFVATAPPLRVTAVRQILPA